MPIAVDKFDNNVLSRCRRSPCAKSDAVGGVFQKADIFKLYVSTAMRTVSSDRREVARISGKIVRWMQTLII